MHRIISAEFSRRSCYVSLRAFEAYGELRAKDWPRQWSRLREPGSIELWFGRVYICLSRVQGPAAEPAPGPQEAASPPQTEECQIIAFKAPVRAA
jgi:hypothetical protein